MKNPLLGENNPNYKWTDGFIKEKALEFSNSAAFKKHFPLLYAAARHRGILESVCKHMKRIHRMTYTESELHSIAAQHERRHGFRKNHDGAYQAATKLGILDKICQHMSKSRSVSFAELQLFNEIKNIHPNARKFRDYHVAVEGKPYIKRFEIDIFIPTLNKGIEFDGKYWHTFEVMRIQEHKKNWSDEDIRNYSNIKDNYFKSKGIIILHITEKEWKEDKEQSLTKVLKFLGE